MHAWAAHRVTLYLQLLTVHLARVDEGGGLASVLEHCMYCGMSLARVGLDFRPLLAPVFEGCVLDLFARSAQVRGFESFSLALSLSLSRLSCICSAGGPPISAWASW